MTVMTDVPQVSKPVAKVSSFRPDVQGLRAVAVVAVVIDHLFSYPPGGFIGVDIFFVISGFLITNLLLREYEKTGRISFTDFYKRRIRRIMPAALLVLAVTSTATWLIYSTVRAQGVLIDAFWATFFAANWRFVATGTDYSQADGLVSPIQHYWSLSVEEQFYFVWPVLMVAVFFLVRPRLAEVAGAEVAGVGVAGADVAGASRRSVRVPLGITMGVLIVASFGWALYETVTAPTWAYFSTFSRAWELGVGALLAVAAPLLARIPTAIRPLLSWLGIAGIAVSLYAVTEASAFPGPWAAAPVVSAALIVGAGVGGTPRFVGILTNRVSRYLGDISYSLYLWHWPVIVLLPAFFPEQGIVFYLTAIGLALGLSVLSYHFVEDAIRKSDWLDPSAPRRSRRQLSWRERYREVDPNSTGLIIVSSVLVTALLVFMPGGRQGGISAIEGAAASDPIAAGDDPATAIAASVVESLSATEFPEMTPALDQLDTRTWFSQVADADCLNIETDEQSIACASGPTDTGKDVVIIGDSFGIAWTPGIRAALEPLGWRVHPLTRGECPASEVVVTQANGAPFTSCDNAHEWRKTRIAELQPELTIIAQAQTTVNRLASGAEGEAGASELAAGLRTSVDAFAPSTGAIVVLAPPPTGTSMQSCVTNIGSPSDCVSPVNDLWYQVTAAESRALAGSAATYIPTSTWFCYDGRCPGFVGNTAMRVDTAHLSIQYSEMLAPVIAQAVGEYVTL